ncbi:hypothetical protein B0H11DRAFT_1937617 [Mycena galericulata]|nr:hypothetical protein B0H11DRAFT_1937614 [Mycena galericulata]KAJ7435423.1 hypothetical protein B0H11DRAFT_1937617 [Mycena galericulata]
MAFNIDLPRRGLVIHACEPNQFNLHRTPFPTSPGTWRNSRRPPARQTLGFEVTLTSPPSWDPQPCTHAQVVARGSGAECQNFICLSLARPSAALCATVFSDPANIHSRTPDTYLLEHQVRDVPPPKLSFPAVPRTRFSIAPRLARQRRVAPPSDFLFDILTSAEQNSHLSEHQVHDAPPSKLLFSAVPQTCSNIKNAIPARPTRQRRLAPLSKILFDIRVSAELNRVAPPTKFLFDVWTSAKLNNIKSATRHSSHYYSRESREHIPTYPTRQRRVAPPFKFLFDIWTSAELSCNLSEHQLRDATLFKLLLSAVPRPCFNINYGVSCTPDAKFAMRYPPSYCPRRFLQHLIRHFRTPTRQRRVAPPSKILFDIWTSPELDAIPRSRFSILTHPTRQRRVAPPCKILFDISTSAELHCYLFEHQVPDAPPFKPSFLAVPRTCSNISYGIPAPPTRSAAHQILIRYSDVRRTQFMISRRAIWLNIKSATRRPRNYTLSGPANVFKHRRISGAQHHSPKFYLIFGRPPNSMSIPRRVACPYYLVIIAAANIPPYKIFFDFPTPRDPYVYAPIPVVKITRYSEAPRPTRRSDIRTTTSMSRHTISEFDVRRSRDRCCRKYACAADSICILPDARAFNYPGRGLLREVNANSNSVSSHDSGISGEVFECVVQISEVD